MKHPLTDTMCENIALNAYWSFIPDEVVFTHDDMRAAYDLAIEHVYETWNRLFDEAEVSVPYGRDSTICWRFSRELEKMRTQKDNS